MQDTLSGANNKLPAANVSFDHIMDFLTLLNLETGCVFYLPTEAQWEYAARGGSYLSREKNCRVFKMRIYQTPRIFVV